VEEYDGFDPNSAEGNIFFSMMQNAFLDRSLAFAGSVQHELIGNLHTTDRGLKQAGFLVLYKTAMPGVLIETGFISNAKDEKFLLSEKGQLLLAKSIFNALCNYRNQADKRVPVYQNNDNSTQELNKGEQAKVEEQKADTTVTATNKTVQTANPIHYRVQFAMFPTAEPKDSDVFKGIDDVKMYRQAGAYKYTSGDFDSFQEADHHRIALIAKGYKDAFVVVFKGEERITLQEAKRLTGKK